VDSGAYNTLLCVLKDDLFAAEDELFREEGQTINRLIYEIKTSTTDKTILARKNAQNVQF